MNRKSRCRCPLCLMERHLTERFSGADGHETYQQLAKVSLAASSFPAASHLLCYLHTQSDPEQGCLPKDQILSELLQATVASNGCASAARELLLLAFVPMLHRLSRQASTRWPALSREDISQHLVVAMLGALDAIAATSRHSHIAFAISRILRRNTFVWAQREAQGSFSGANLFETPEHVLSGDGAQPIERTVMLRHFLDRCERRGVLSGQDVELLTQFKLDDTWAPDHSNASRQRVKRLVRKLRQAAQNPRRVEDHQLRLF